jgi:Raf kinase inhibitor-like YbhB/YbcL family protein
MRRAGPVAAVVTLLASCGGGGEAVPSVRASASMQVSSEAFADGQAIPGRYTCDGRDVSPPLSWSPASGASEYELVVTDVDAPGGGFVHWAVFGIPPEQHGFAEGARPGGVELRNDSGETGYRGPCPPSEDGPHRYVFTVYAVRGGPAPPEPGTLPRDAVAAISCCVVARGSVTGTYDRA